jgi:hypothetical protein
MKAHLIRGAFYLFLLPACVLPFALGQQDSDERSAAKIAQLPVTSSDSGAGALATPECPTGIVLWDQYNNPATEPPLAIGSQNFEPAMAAFDDQAADDFVFTYPFANVITGVRVMGEYSKGGGPASSFNVYIYGNAQGHVPGGLIASLLNLPYTGTPPDFTINLISLVNLGSGTYWISVQARQDLIQTVSGSGTIELFNQTLALSGKTRATATARAALAGTERTPVCPTRYCPVRCSKSSASLKAPRPRLLPHLELPRLRDPVLAHRHAVTSLYEKETHCSIRLA